MQKMDELIRREDALAVIEPMLLKEPGSDGMSHDEVLLHHVQKKLQQVPAADAKMVERGYWIEKTHDDGFGAYDMLHCSRCDAPSSRKRKFCYECGASMDKKVRRDGDS